MTEKRQPERRCAGCMQSFPKASLIRITAGKDGRLSTDAAAPGRGVYVCKNEKCLALAEKKNAIQRGLKTSIDRSEAERLRASVTEIIRTNNTLRGDVDAK